MGRRVEPSRRMVTTVLHYDRPMLARLIRAVVGVGHRRTARRLIAGRGNGCIPPAGRAPHGELLAAFAAAGVLGIDPARLPQPGQ